MGSTNMDLVAYVATAPRRGETVTGHAFRTVPGGKGANQAVAAARSGGTVSMIGAVGDDDFGPRLRAALEDSGVDDGPAAHRRGRERHGAHRRRRRGRQRDRRRPRRQRHRPRAGRRRRAAHRRGRRAAPPAGDPPRRCARRRRGPRTRTVSASCSPPRPRSSCPPNSSAVTGLLVPNEHEAAVLHRQVRPARRGRRTARAGTRGGRHARRRGLPLGHPRRGAACTCPPPA